MTNGIYQPGRRSQPGFSFNNGKFNWKSNPLSRNAGDCGQVAGVVQQAHPVASSSSSDIVTGSRRGAVGEAQNVEEPRSLPPKKLLAKKAAKGID